MAKKALRKHLLSLASILFLSTFPSQLWFETSLADTENILLSVDEETSPSYSLEYAKASLTSPYYENFTKSVDFLTRLQAQDGGLMEAEDNGYENTDNTLEAIWVWSRYYEMNGDNKYFVNIANAWNYSVKHPAWLELDSGKVYSSAWAIRAELQFRRAYSNSTYNWYSNESAKYIVLRDAWEAGSFPPAAKVHIKAWAAGNLFDYGVFSGNETAKWMAVQYGNETMALIEADPSLLSTEGWALAGGASMWGIAHSTMREFPNASWVQKYASYLKKEVMEPGTGPGNSQNGWEAWYAFGHLSAYNVTLDKVHYLNFLNITDRLLARDGDLDGGIPTNVGDPDNTDESWVTSYRAFFCLENFIDMDVGDPPGAPVILSSYLSGSNLENVTLEWNLSLDDGAGSRDVIAYEVYHSQSYTEVGYNLIGMLLNGTRNFTHFGAGLDGLNHFYYVAVRDFQGWRNSSREYGAKVSIRLRAGINLVSIPLILSNHSLEATLHSVSYDKVWYYDPTNKLDPWKAYMKFKTLNDLLTVDRTMALWINVTEDTNLTVAGVVPTSTQIPVETGWNFVGFPSFKTYTIADLRTETGAKRVEGYDPNASPYYLRVLPDNYVLKAGEGYWIYASSTTTWTVNN